jgi:alpha-beta hydrolase superfamily lysophospholipase
MGGSSTATTEPLDVTVPAADGLALRAWYWPRPRPRGVLVLSHGLGEHAGCYRHVAEALGEALEFDVLAFDYRGHGRSPGRRGVVRRYDELTADLRAALAWAARERPGLPRFVLGHSNGGQVALRAALEGEPIAGLILSNPSLQLAVRVPAWKRLVGEVLLRVAPGVTLAATLPDALMTNDPENLASRRDDPLRHSRISAPLFFGMVAGGPLLSARAGEIGVPVLLLLGGADPVIDAAASRAAFERLGSPDKTLRVYPEMLHEPLNDLDRGRVLDDIAAWISARVAPPPRP